MAHKKNCSAKDDSQVNFSGWKRSKTSMKHVRKTEYRDKSCKICGRHLGRENRSA